jgi:hypothetical protein
MENGVKLFLTFVSLKLFTDNLDFLQMGGFNGLLKIVKSILVESINIYWMLTQKRNILFKPRF